jgi:hypothetical protein
MLVDGDANFLVCYGDSREEMQIWVGIYCTPIFWTVDAGKPSINEILDPDSIYYLWKTDDLTTNYLGDRGLMPTIGIARPIDNFNLDNFLLSVYFEGIFSFGIKIC